MTGSRRFASTPDLQPLCGDLTFLSPLSDQRAADLVRFLADGRPGTLLDIGCGGGELLMRAVAAALSGREDEFLHAEAIRALAEDCGFRVVEAQEASQGEWDAFESGFVRRLGRWLEAHPEDHPEAAAVREQLRDQRERYLHGYRGVLGMVYLTLVAG